MSELILLILLLILAVFAPLVWVFATRRWQLTLFAVMILMVFEGALRKWVLPQFQTQIYLLKDVLVIIAAFGFLAARKEQGLHESLMGALKGLLVLNLVFGFLELANPNSPSVLVGILGLKNYMLYALLVFMIPYAFNSIDDIDRKLRIYMILMIPVAILGLIQFTSPATSVLNIYVNNYDADISIATFGKNQEYARASGTFSYIGGYSTFVTVMFNLSLAYVLTAPGNLRKNLVPYILLAASTGAMFTTGSRSVVWGVIGIAPIVLFLCLRAHLITGTLFARVLIGIAFVAVVLAYFASDAVDAFNDRARNADDAIVRALSPFTDLAAAFEVSPLFGLGIGVTHGAAGAVMGMGTLDPWWLHGQSFELETGRVMQELGMFGFMLVFAVRVYLIFLAATMVTRLRTPLFKALSAVIAGLFVLHLGLSVINNPTAGLYYWFAAGLLFAMYRLDMIAQTSTVLMPAPTWAPPQRACVR
jgi:hypothetical protein